MSAKAHVGFFCTGCGHEESRWAGRCPACGAWESMTEAPAATAGSGRVSKRGGGARSPRASRSPGTSGSSLSSPIAQVASEDAPRFSAGSTEVDRVLGGGVVRGSVVLLGGEPGVGKSTLLLQIASSVARAGGTALYASGEESPQQIRLRGERLGRLDERLLVMGETDVGAICAEAERLQPQLLVVDSIQTVADPEAGGSPGSPTQIRASTHRLLDLAKARGIATVVVGHVTKDGDLAGPKLLEHMVDTVLSFEGDPNQAHRFLRAVKNRFGPASELGVFLMESAGLTDVSNPSALFIHRDSLRQAGAVLAPAVVGTRSYVLEVQALVTDNAFTFGRRIAQGWDLNRLNVILSVVEKRLELPMGQKDVCINVAGGLQVKEPALDAAVALAIVSSVRNVPAPADVAVSGEVGLSGELRPVHRLDQRADEARRVGCTVLYHPPMEGPLGPAARRPPEGLTLRPLRDLRELADLVRRDV